MRGIVSSKLAPLLADVNKALEEIKANNIPFEVDITRQNLNNLSALMGTGPDIASIQDKSLAHDNGVINTRIYHPAPEQALPVALHFHGGGHMCGSVELYDPISRRIADTCRVVVIAVDYRLAPEHPYPAGIDDCTLALRHIDQLRSDIKHNGQVFIIGDSAGGAICTTLALKSLTDSSLTIDKQLLIYPSVDYTMSSPSIDENGQGFLLEKGKIQWYFEQYFQSRDSQQTRFDASPLLNTINKALPPTLVITAGCDPLRDEGVQYAKALAGAGVEVTHHSFDDMIHAYMLLHDLVEHECQQTYQAMSDFISR
ncbi:alpha/beta hydrolase [Thalassotalea ponticola]|uniref:alpha/beta hydrolase n=1 Tax=Thalassotalea ponticola TaxID=1523392 RepID=UPI0025B5E408|nr:alpha/beta hydrolase [Thalassotalea ponticola]MDN3653142.1 alpha/beta hydrolase [Thalassotalea ponticola]